MTGRRIIKIGILVFMILMQIGCKKTEEVWKPVSEDRIRIAVAGEESYIRSNGVMEAMELASEDFYKKTGTKIDIVIYDDKAEYNQAIICAKEIVADKSISAVLIKQELDFIDATAEIFNQAKLPFILTNGCYERTVNHHYDYMLVNCLNARIAGGIMAKYVTGQNYSKIAFCHSDTEYEEDELKGFQTEIEGSEVRLADTLVGPYTQEEFDIAYERWVDLGIEAVCISNYDILNSDLVRMLREKGSKIAVIGDYVMDTEEDINTNGAYMDDTVIVGMYINDQKEDNQEIIQRFEDTYHMKMSEKAIQSYDTISMLGEQLTSGVTTSLELLKKIKENGSYQGISGTVAFDENGCLIPNGNEILIFQNGRFH